MREVPGRDAFGAEFGVSRETLDRLEHFAGLLEKWTRRINLVSRGSLPEIWQRHIADSAQLLAHAPQNTRRWADLGSGGGFPGVILAIIAAELRPETAFHLVESDQRKAAFLSAATRETGIAAHIHAERAESLEPLSADVVSARALASVTRLLPLLRRHIRPGGIAILPKGAGWRKEVEEALEKHDFTYDKKESRTDVDGAILILRNLDNAPEG